MNGTSECDNKLQQTARFLIGRLEGFWIAERPLNFFVLLLLLSNLTGGVNTCYRFSYGEIVNFQIKHYVSIKIDLYSKIPAKFFYIIKLSTIPIIAELPTIFFIAKYYSKMTQNTHSCVQIDVAIKLCLNI